MLMMHAAAHAIYRDVAGSSARHMMRQRYRRATFCSVRGCIATPYRAIYHHAHAESHRRGEIGEAKQCARRWHYIFDIRFALM